MTRLLRRLLTLLLVAALTAGGALWWLYEGDVREISDDLAATELPVEELTGGER